MGINECLSFCLFLMFSFTIKQEREPYFQMSNELKSKQYFLIEQVHNINIYHFFLQLIFVSKMLLTAKAESHYF